MDDSLDAFGSEESPPFRRDRGPRPWRSKNAGILLFTVLLVFGAFALQKWGPYVGNASAFGGAAPPSPNSPITPVTADAEEASSGSLTIESTPTGAEVRLAGVARGTTPLALTVAPGTHSLEIVLGERRKSLTATATEGAAVVHHVELPEVRPAIDSLPAVEPAPAPAPAVSKPARPAGPVAGWLIVSSDVPIQVMKGNEVIGTSAASRIMLPAGRHDLRFYNDSLGFSQRRIVQVAAGRSESVRVKVPSAALSINAIPWAETWIDGKRIGETPIGNYLVPIGAHEVVFRHPDFGERRQTVVVSLVKPARISVNMRESR